MMTGLALLIATLAAQETAPPLPAPTSALCRDASEKIENGVGYLLRQPTVISAKMNAKQIELMARIEAFKLRGRPLADAMSERFHPRPRDQQGTPDPGVAAMGYEQLFAFSEACLATQLPPP